MAAPVCGGGCLHGVEEGVDHATAIECVAEPETSFLEPNWDAVLAIFETPTKIGLTSFRICIARSESSGSRFLLPLELA